MICRTVRIAVILFLCSVAAAADTPIRDLQPTVLMIAIDGFRYDYPEKFKTPNLDAIAKKGVRAEWMKPSFPTKTFPNFYTLVTGLYPEEHGIVENNIFDFGTVFSLGNKPEVSNGRWWLGEPIWVTAEKQGVRTAPYLYPGTEAEIAGRRPSFWTEYIHDMPASQKIDKIIELLQLPAAERPRYLSIYFHDVDTAGHEFSPDSPETQKAVENVDAAIGVLLSRLKELGIEKKINIVVVSDHGMASVPESNAVLIERYFDTDDAERILWGGQIVQIFPRPGKKDEIAAKLAAVEHATCLPKEKLPARLNYSTGTRVAPIVCYADEGWNLTNALRFERIQGRKDFPRIRGEHGYDNEAESMRAVFIARGPAFRRTGRTVRLTNADGTTKKVRMTEPFPNVDVYNILCRIIGLTPAKNSGDRKQIEKILRPRR